jgi:hypothetical protein
MDPSRFARHIWVRDKRRLLPYIRPVYANVLPLALMNFARLDLNRRSASKEPLHRSGSQDDGLTCLVINR